MEIVFSETEKQAFGELQKKINDKEHVILGEAFQKTQKDLEENVRNYQNETLLLIKECLMENGVKATTEECKLWKFDGISKLTKEDKKEDPKDSKKEERK